MMEGQQSPEIAHDPGDAPDNPFLKLRSRTLIWWMIVGSIVVFVVAALAGLISPLDPLESTTGDIVVEVAFYGLVVVWIVWACRNADIDLGRFVGRVPAGYNWLPAVGLLVTTMTFSLGSLSVAFYGLSRVSPELLESLLSVGGPDPDSMISLVWWVIAAVAVAPVSEEVLFRGVFLSRWGVKWGIGTGIVVSSAIFGILHVDAAGGMASGVVASLLYLQSRTLIVPIAFHAANNLVATAAIFIPASDEPWTFAAELAEIEAMALPGLAMVVVTLPVLIWYVRRHWPSRDAEIPYIKE
ncbi:CPBP family intramembrane glutamic endopeptidase [Candidatus Palauibacter sp.]|uniref:CPBP family intramembrane glutamic endopeptidase n=1 Tax=Candidatus Palauibacter sp. TaxID=3101350 RepID=UPI003B02DED5